jgi:adenine-specific DNA-methyltransferase
MTEPEKLDLRSHDTAEDKRQELLRLFPKIRTEGGKIDFERLKLTLGEIIDVGKERYGMNWPGKGDCFKTIQAPSLGTLRPCREESVNFDATENLIIEGDNLEVLKLLQKSYLGKVKMIYIDPPYNTGNDFIYPDNYTESLQTYLEYTGQVDSQGKKFSTNMEADGRFHSKWLNMMYPRLYLAHNLLSPEGLLFISIDDGEVDNLRKLCNETFGEEAFVAQFVWKSRVSEDTRAKTYVLCYGASESQALRGAHKDLSKFANPDNDPRGPWRSADLTGLATRDARPNLHYDLVDPATSLNYGCPPKGWRFDPTTMRRKIAEGRVLWPANPDGRPRHKLFLNEMESQFKNISSVLSNSAALRALRRRSLTTASGARAALRRTATLAWDLPGSPIRRPIARLSVGDPHTSASSAILRYLGSRRISATLALRRATSSSVKGFRCPS